jgi:hypothetical protein
VASAKEVPAGKRRLSVRFTPRSKSVKPDFFTGDVSLFINAEKVGEIKDTKMAGQYSAITGYGLLFGRNTGTPVSHSYEPPFTFTGTIEKVTVEVDGASKGEVIARPKIDPDPFLRNLYWSQVRLRSKLYAVRIFYLGIVKQTPLSQCPLLSLYVSARPTTSTSNATGKVIGSPATATASPAAPS